jgi:hypothetical protein
MVLIACTHSFSDSDPVMIAPCSVISIEACGDMAICDMSLA